MKDLCLPISLWAAAVGVAILAGCSTTTPTAGRTLIPARPFGAAPDGRPVTLYTLRNSRGVEAQICNYGGIVVSLKVPDRNGQFGDVVLGYDKLADYVADSPYFGCLIGRYGNRIARGRFTLNKINYALATNNYPNHLHGGIRGFDKVVWQARPLPNHRYGHALELKHISRAGAEGYPGELEVTAVYSLTEDDALRLDYTATTDQDTIINLTQHSYFNLAGHGDILGHEVMIRANTFTPVDETLIPTGEFRGVERTPFDFNTPTAIGARINEPDEQLKFGKGYDHNWVIRKPFGELGLVARVTEPTSGRVLEVFSTEPGLQFYSGNFLDGTLKGKGGWVYQFRNGFCMEPQHYPDSPNKPNFPSVVLRRGQVYRNTIIYKFSVSR